MCECMFICMFLMCAKGQNIMIALSQYVPLPTVTSPCTAVRTTYQHTCTAVRTTHQHTCTAVRTTHQHTCTAVRTTYQHTCTAVRTTHQHTCTAVCTTYQHTSHKPTLCSSEHDNYYPYSIKLISFLTS